MASKIEPILLDGLNYVVWETNMEMLLKGKDLLKYTNVCILDVSDDQVKFVIDKSQNKVVGVITTYNNPI